MLVIQLLLFIFLYFHTILALFVVTAPKSTYTARYGETVKMICNFSIPKQHDLNKLIVSWKHFPQEHHEARQVTTFNNGREDVSKQDNMYKGRTSLLVQELKNGKAILQIEEVKPTDAGTYFCLLQLGGSESQDIKLNIQASYSNITTSHISEDNEISLTCESLGFPRAEVYWRKNGVNISSSVNTSHTQTPDGLYRIKSTIKGIDVNQSYNCVFWNKALTEETQASPIHSDSGHHGKLLQTVILSVIGCVVIIILVVVVLFSKKHIGLSSASRKKVQSSSKITSSLSWFW